MIKPKIIFLLESISQPRCIKRINSFISYGYDVEIYGIDRGLYNENATISGKRINIINEGKDQKSYFSKYKYIKEIANNSEILYYSFGFPLTLSLRLNGCKNYIYEISDILYTDNKLRFLKRLLISVDKNLIRKSRLTVMTSEGFADFLFKKKWPKNIIIQPNKLNIYFKEVARKEPNFEVNINKLIFAYVGAFRYPNTVFRFAKLVGEKYPQHEFHFYGDSTLTNKVIEMSQKYDNVKYFGSYKNPQDLVSVYNNIDLIVACYDIQRINERIAEPNKLYEALYFNKPIIVSQNTYLSNKVEKYNCGYVINASKDTNIENFIESLTNEDLHNKINSISEIRTSEVIDDNSSKIFSYLEDN